ncbi:MAG: rRNA pseudouridine synthase [Olsenella sp.]|nr:rRNA pseudouridine synthase [Olsenella sp.]
MRLQKFLARAGVASRRGSENLMTAGRVAVNGVIVTELGSKVDPERDVVTVDGVVHTLADGHAYVMLYKPSGYITTMSDPQGRPCVASLVPTERYPGLFPVGRLDGDTTGLLLFTTNGEVGNRMLHPSRHVWKRYVALVRGTPTARQLERLREGVPLDDGTSAPAKAALLAEGDPRAAAVAAEGCPYGHAVVQLTIHEGRKHQVKRMLKAVGHEVVRLHRDSFGPLGLTGLMPGEWRPLTADERAAIEALASPRAERDGGPHAGSAPDTYHKESNHA